MVNRFDADETRKPQDTLVFIAMTHYLRGGYKHLLPMLKSICPSVLVDTHICSPFCCVGLRPSSRILVAYSPRRWGSGQSFGTTRRIGVSKFRSGRLRSWSQLGRWKSVSRGKQARLGLEFGLSVDGTGIVM